MHQNPARIVQFDALQADKPKSKTTFLTARLHARDRHRPSGYQPLAPNQPLASQGVAVARFVAARDKVTNALSELERSYRAGRSLVTTAGRLDQAVPIPKQKVA
jgi:hypothetical protein